MLTVRQRFQTSARIRWPPTFWFCRRRRRHHAPHRAAQQRNSPSSLQADKMGGFQAPHFFGQLIINSFADATLLYFSSLIWPACLMKTFLRVVVAVCLLLIPSAFAQNLRLPRDPDKLIERVQAFWQNVAAGQRL